MYLSIFCNIMYNGTGPAGVTHPTTGPTEEEYESGNGPSLPQSPASLEPPTLDSDDDEKLLAK